MSISGFGTGTFGGGSAAGALAPPPFTPPPEIAAEPWPATLPNWVLAEGYKEGTMNLVKRTPMETGPAKQRPLFTAGPRRYVLPFCMDKDQVAVFEDFYFTNLQHGVVPFLLNHPRTGVETAFRLIAGQPIPIQPDDDGSYYTVTLQAEVLP